MISYIKESEVPEGKLPIYFCNATITIVQTKRQKKDTFNREIEKIVLKGLNEDDLIIALKKKYGRSFFSKTESKNSKITDVKIELINSLGFGVKE